MTASLGESSRLLLIAVELIIAVAIIVVMVLSLWDLMVEVRTASAQLSSGNTTAAHVTILIMVDLIIIMLLAADLMRTIVISVREGYISIRSIVEVAMIVIVREMVATSITQQEINTVSIMELALAFLAVAAAYVITSMFRGGEETHQGCPQAP
ncbi:MAG: phosphate-starvation-inducible PsiE family protein [Acidilobus sp.]